MAEPSIKVLTDLFNQVLTKEKPSKLLHSWDLPSFRGEGHESAEDFLLKFERVGLANKWENDDKLKHMYLCCDRSASKSHDHNKGIKTWNEMKQKFLSTFGKSRVDLDLQGESRKNQVAENPLSYVFTCLEYLEVSNPDATEETKVNALFDGLPNYLKAAFVRDLPIP